MKVPYNWLKTYIDFPYTPEELSYKLTMAGLEVEGVDYLGEGLEDVIVGRIEEIEEHPDADKLVICKTDIGSQILQLVTGAPNVAEGIKVPVAPAGTVLQGNMAIKKTKLRGIESEGMVCSKDELGLMEERAAGIMILDEEATIGQKLVDYLGLDEYVLNIDLTPNYARCLGMLGLAREVKAMLDNEKINYPEINLNPVEDKNIDDFIKIEIEDEDLCPRYSGRLIKNIEIAPSPEWMQQRLHAAGIRPINNIVDITNYILLEYNQPLHAFDYDKISGKKIIVRRAGKEEELVTLDGEARKLDSDVLVIADLEKPVGLAGVMGGANSEVTGNTTDVFLESAYFAPANIRKTARKFGLPSEASYRFERGVDIENVIEASDRAAYLMQKYAGGEVVNGIVDNYPQPEPELDITLNINRINQILGINLSAQEVSQMLGKLDFEVTGKGNVLQVKVPSYRNDVEQDVDLIEEVARMYGYNKIPVTRSESKQQGKEFPGQKVRDTVRKIMVASGLDEAITFSLMDKDIYDMINIPDNDFLRRWVEIKNPLNEAFSIMRTSLLPNLIRVVSNNAKRQLTELRFFEIGKVFFEKNNNKPGEEMKLAGVSMGYPEDIWNTGAGDFFYLKGVLENLWDRLELDQLEFIKSSISYLHPGRTAVIKYRGKKIGIIGELASDLIEEFDLKQGTAIFEMDLEVLETETSLGNFRYVTLPKFPAISRDLAVVVKEDLPAADILEEIKKNGGDLLKQVNLFDVYQGDQIADDDKSLAFEILFQASDRTLTDKEVNKLFAKIINSLEDEFGADVRKS